MELILQIAAISGITAICAVILKRYVPEIALALTLAAGALLLFLVSGALSEVLRFARQMAEAAGLTSELTIPVFKAVGISLITRLAAQFCRDAGEGSVAACCELAGTFSAVVAALPLLQSVFSMITSLL